MTLLALSQLARIWQLNLTLYLVGQPNLDFMVWHSCHPELVFHHTVEFMTSRLPLVCRLWFGVCKVMLPVKHRARKILIAVNFCGRQLARSLGCSASAYYKKEGAPPHAGACKHSMQFDRRPDVRFGVRAGMWNLVSLSGKGEDLRKRMIDVCCLLEVRWRG